MTTAEPITGVELARAARRLIDTEPRSFNMSFWAKRKECGTTFCLAGLGVVLNGAELITEDEAINEAINGAPARYENTSSGTLLLSYARMPDGEVEHVGEIAARLFGITPADAEHVFYGDEEQAVEWLDEYIRTGEVPDLAEMWDVDPDDDEDDD